MIKAQVHAGGRGKAGGVKLARDLDTVRSATADMLGQRLVTKQTGPEGLPIEVFDGFRSALAANRAQFFRDVPAGPFYSFNREGAIEQEGVIQNWWRQGMMGGAKAHYDGIKAFSETDQTEDLKAITVPTLVLHGDDDQIVPIDASAGRWLAAAIFFWGYFVPIGDIAWNLYGGRGDLAVGGLDGLVVQVVGTIALLAALAAAKSAGSTARSGARRGPYRNRPHPRPGCEPPAWQL